MKDLNYQFKLPSNQNHDARYETQQDCAHPIAGQGSLIPGPCSYCERFRGNEFETGNVGFSNLNRLRLANGQANVEELSGRKSLVEGGPTLQSLPEELRRSPSAPSRFMGVELGHDREMVESTFLALDGVKGAVSKQPIRCYLRGQNLKRLAPISLLRPRFQVADSQNRPVTGENRPTDNHDLTLTCSKAAIRSESCRSPDRVMLLADMKALQRITDNSLRQCP